MEFENKYLYLYLYNILYQLEYYYIYYCDFMFQLLCSRGSALWDIYEDIPCWLLASCLTFALCCVCLWTEVRPWAWSTRCAYSYWGWWGQRCIMGYCSVNAVSSTSNSAPRHRRDTTTLLFYHLLLWITQSTMSPANKGHPVCSPHLAPGVN